MKNEEPQFISLAQAAKLTNYSQDYISLLCRQKKLKAEKLGRNWVTTKEWVYEYVDKTEGKGAASVPVKVREGEKKENSSGKKPVRPLFGNSALELAIFCTISVILLANAVGFWRGVQAIDQDSELVQKYTDYQYHLTSQRSAGDDDLTVKYLETNGAACDQASSSLSLMSFDKETDPAVITQVTQKVQQSLTETVTVEVYRTFAIVTETADPEKKFIYVIR